MFAGFFERVEMSLVGPMLAFFFPPESVFCYVPGCIAYDMSISLFSFLLLHRIGCNLRAHLTTLCISRMGPGGVQKPPDSKLELLMSRLVNFLAVTELIPLSRTRFIDHYQTTWRTLQEGRYIQKHPAFPPAS